MPLPGTGNFPWPRLFRKIGERLTVRDISLAFFGKKPF